MQLSRSHSEKDRSRKVQIPVYTIRFMVGEERAIISRF